MSVQQFYESRYCAEGLKGVFFYLNSVFVDFALIAVSNHEKSMHEKDTQKMEYHDTPVRARPAALLRCP
eukprot:12921358-Prorocentrum_lima.AAC.1